MCLNQTGKLQRGLVEIELWAYGRQDLLWNQIYHQEQVGRLFVWNGKIGVVVCGVVWWCVDLLNYVHDDIVLGCRGVREALVRRAS